MASIAMGPNAMGCCEGRRERHRLNPGEVGTAGGAVLEEEACAVSLHQGRGKVRLEELLLRSQSPG